MDRDRYSRVLAEFDGLVELGVAVSIKVVGMQPEPMYLNYLDAIYTKLLAHAISLRKLSPIFSEQTSQLWDFPSACAIARCLIEAHDVLGYMSHEGEGPDERDFRVLLWRLHDAHRRIKMATAIGSTHPHFLKTREKAESLTHEVMSHSQYPKISIEMQRKIRTGDAPHATLTQRGMNERNGVDHDYHTAATMWLSQYVHTYPMAVHQLRAFRAGTPEALGMSAMPIQYACGFLASAIFKMAEAFPVATPQPTATQARAFETWRAVVRSGVKSSLK